MLEILSLESLLPQIFKIPFLRRPLTISGAQTSLRISLSRQLNNLAPGRLLIFGDQILGVIPLKCFYIFKLNLRIDLLTRPLWQLIIHTEVGWWLFSNYHRGLWQIQTGF